MLRLVDNAAKRIRDDGDKHIDEPEIENDQTDDEEQAGNKVIRRHHLVHCRRPSVTRHNNDDLEDCRSKIIEAQSAVVRVTAFLEVCNANQ